MSKLRVSNVFRLIANRGKSHPTLPCAGRIVRKAEAVWYSTGRLSSQCVQREIFVRSRVIIIGCQVFLIIPEYRSSLVFIKLGFDKREYKREKASIVFLYHFIVNGRMVIFRIVLSRQSPIMMKSCPSNVVNGRRF